MENMGKRSVKETVEFIALMGLALISVYIAFSGYLTFLPGPAQSQTSSFVLGVLGVIVGYLALERRAKLDAIEQHVSHIAQQVDSAAGEPTRVLRDVKQVYSELSRRIAQAEQSVEILAWGREQIPSRTVAQQAEFHRWVARKLEVAKREEIAFREIVSFPPSEPGLSRFQAREQLLTVPGYELWYCDISYVNLPPTMTFVIVDGRDLIIPFYRGATEGREGEVHLVTSHPDIVHLFRDYFEVVIRSATLVKAANKEPLPEVLEHIRQTLERTNGDASLELRHNSDRMPIAYATGQPSITVVDM
jgi:hypothetical protein